MKRLTLNHFFLFAIAFVMVAFSLKPLFTQLIFTYDQTRDAYESYDIWHNHDLKLLGPATDITGLYHGPLWYYLISIPYALGNNPEVVGIFFFLLLWLSVPLAAFVSLRLFKSYQLAVLTGVLYGFSPLFQASTRWLSNPIIALLVMPFLMYFLWEFLNKKSGKTPFLLGITFGILIQADLAYLLILLMLPVYLLVFRYLPSFRTLLLLFLGLIISLSSFVLAELKFHGQGILATLNFIHATKSPHDIPSLLTLIFSRLEYLFQVSVLPLPNIIPWIVILALVYLGRKKIFSEKKQLLFLVLWLCNIPLFFFFSSGISTSSFIFFPSLLALVMLTSYLIHISLQNRWQVISITILLVISQLIFSYSWITNKFSPFPAQQRAFYSEAIKVIDYTYQQSHNKSFAINTITVPLYFNTTWTYLYEFYGQKKYGYVPSWEGDAKESYLRVVDKPSTDAAEKFLIVEPQVGLSDYFVSLIRKKENMRSDLISTKNIGEYTIELRKRKK